METKRPQIYMLFLLCLFFLNTSAQIITDSNPPYDSPVFLVDSILLGEGVVATNHSYQGDALQIGFFNGINSNIGLDSGIVMGTGDILEIVPGALGGFFANAVNDPDLLDVASSVPDLIDQNFTVTSVNDVAILEFDFVPVSSFVSFKYVFASEEYFAYENTQFNDVFGFFISGPNIVGPYSSPPEFPDGSVNIATFESAEANSLGVDLPITISSVNSSYNPALFVTNQNNGLNTINSTVDGFTTVITAEADVVCGELYHIRLAIADGTDASLSSFVLLEAGSFSSPPLNVTNSLNVDSNKIFTDCGEPVILTADVGGDNFEFLWNTGETTQSINATSGYYWVQATDPTGCSVQSDSLRVFSQPSPEILLPQEDYYCEGDSYLINPIINSGTPPFNFDWGFLGDDTQIEVNEPGIYNLTVVDSNGCSDSHTIELFEKSLPDVSYSPQEILICGGIPVEVTANGADNYIWSPNISLSSDTGSTIQISSLSSITYSLEGIDSIGCSTTVLVPTTATDDFDLQIDVSPVSCQGYSNGSIVILPQSTAVSPIQYSIDGGENYFNYFTFDNLDFGTYDIKVKDGIGCVISDNVVVESAQPAIELLTSSINVECPSDSTGLIRVEEVSGGNVSAGYSYTWFNSGTDEVVGTDSILSVPAGGYYIIVEDDNGCQASDEVSLTQPNPISYSYTKNDITCFGGNDGQIIISIDGGGTPPYSLDWVSFGNASTSYLYNLQDGVYDLEISDANDCVSALSIELSESTTPLSIQVESLDISCFGTATGSAQVMANGGTPPYSFQWSSGHVTEIAEQISSGVYLVEVSDSRGCVVTDSVEIYENPEIVSELTSTPTTCFGSNDGTATISSVGGTGDLSYAWSNEVNSSSITSGFGEYWVIVEDQLGCITEDTIFINQPQKLRVELSTTDVSCFGGFDAEISSEVIGGTPFPDMSYAYSWTFNDGPIGINNSTLSTINSSNLPYVLNVTDNNGCTHTAYAFVDEPPALTLDTSEIIPTYCLNIPAGQASVVASGGFLNPLGSYTFNWNTGDSGSILSNQTSGLYTVVVEDDNSCKDTLTIEIPLEDNFILDITSTALNCYEDASGSATVISSGGSGPYVYDWNTSLSVASQQMSSVNSNTILNLSQGVTSVVVTDVNGCAKTTQVNVSQPEELLFTVFKNSDESCSGEVSSCDGELEVEVEGGFGIYTISCSDASNNLISS
ncbi:SprB repeat-containing protein, partial [Flavobacteriales bacterium]|nr:SprB repeat-containing protein [Flavobacteriales bacterium]